MKTSNDLDTLRWGERALARFTPTGNVITQQTSQLVRARWRRPVTWQVQVYIEPLTGFTPAVETATFTIKFVTTVGVGQATTDIASLYSLAPGGGGIYLPIRDNGLIPGQHLQIVAVVSGLATNNAEHLLALSAFVAPVTDPAAMSELLELLAREREPAQDVVLEDWHLRPGQFR
jgi:hypothetical protein